MIELEINGTQHRLDVEGDMPLLWAIRDAAGMTGTKFGCGMAQCGACTVHVNGQPRRACVTPVAAVAGQVVTTIEGLNSPQGQALKRAWRALEVVQCGYCQSGQLMQAAALLTHNPAPDDTAIDAAMTGNICRCGTYHRIRAAIKHAAADLA